MPMLSLRCRPAAAELLQITDYDLSTIKRYWFAEAQVAGVEALIGRRATPERMVELSPSRPGTGVMGCYSGLTRGTLPIGLGARDTLRLEEIYLMQMYP